MARVRCLIVAATVTLLLVGAQDASALVWGIRSTATNSPPAYSAPPVELFSINEDGTGYVDHGTIVNISPGVGRPTNFDGLAYNSRFGLMAFEVFGSGTTSRLATIDPDGNGTYAVTATKVDLALSGREIRGAAFDEKGRLWALDTIGNVLLQVDPLTGGMIGSPQSLTLGGSPYTFEGNTVDLAVTPEGKAYMTAVAASDARVYTLDTNTGVVTEIRQDPNWLGEVGATFSLPTGPTQLFALDVSGAEDFVRYDLPPAGGIPRSVEFTLPSTMNAGRGDLAANIQEFPYLRHDGDVDPYVAEGWSRRIAGSGITVGPVPEERAWCVDDQSSAGSNGFGYYKHLSPEQWDRAMRVGWSLAMEVRVEDYQPFSFGGASSGQVAIPGRRRRRPHRRALRRQRELAPDARHRGRRLPPLRAGLQPKPPDGGPLRRRRADAHGLRRDDPHAGHQPRAVRGQQQCRHGHRVLPDGALRDRAGARDAVDPRPRRAGIAAPPPSRRSRLTPDPGVRRPLLLNRARRRPRPRRRRSDSPPSRRHDAKRLGPRGSSAEDEDENEDENE